MKVSLIILFIGLLTIAPSIYVGIKYFDGKVTEHPYETGIRYSEDNKFIKENGISLSIIKNTRDGENVNLEFSINKNSGVNVDDAVFFITRPATDKEQIQIKTDVTGSGSFASVFSVSSNGYYILKAQCRISGKEIALQKSFYIN